MAAGWLHAVDGWRQNPHIGQSVAFDRAFNFFFGQGLGSKDRPLGALNDPVAQMADPRDGKCHSAASLSSTPMKPPL